MYDFESDRPAAARATPLPLPSRWLTLAEAPRLLGELGSSLALSPLAAGLSRVTGRHRAADHRTVLVLPGFHAADWLTLRLRSHLSGLGYDVHGWGLGTNHGLTDRLVDGVLERFDEVADGAEGPVTVVGWSFGGMSARWLGHRRTSRVRHVVTLGSPWRREGEITRATPGFQRAASTHGLSQRARRIVDEAREPLPMTSTAIWSRTDGVVSWRGCTVEGHDPFGEDVEVVSSHAGLVTNPLALAAVASRLATAPAKQAATA